MMCFLLPDIIYKHLKYLLRHMCLVSIHYLLLSYLWISCHDHFSFTTTSTALLPLSHHLN